MADNRISLCIIVGNVEHYITRFIKSFKPLYDELIVVRAIGNAEPDRTMDIAKEHGARTAIYTNERLLDVPHVDNFAAARNLAFSMATHPWQMWADTDDVISAESIETIKVIVERHGHEADIFALPYDIPGTGINHLRERIARKGTAHWIQAVHECMAPVDGIKWRVISCQEASIVHLPSGFAEPDKKGRNRRILESLPEAEVNSSLRYHLFTEYLMAGEFGKAKETAAKYFALPDAGETEKYEMLLGLGATATGLQDKLTWFLSALRESPWRREAFLELANIYLDYGEPTKALAYARALTALPMPTKDVPWQLRRRCYGDLAVGVLARAHRASGDPVLADTLERNYFKDHGALISLLHATRGRPVQALQAKKKWLMRAANPDAIEHIFAVDADDAESRYMRSHRHVVSSGGGCVAAWNLAAQQSGGKVLIQLSDDWEPPIHWDALILERLGDISRPTVLQVNDGHRTDDLLCMAILTRARYEQQGYLFHPDFTGVYSDNWFSHCAFRDGVVVDARDITFHHLHPAFDASVKVDETYARQNSGDAYEKGKAIFDRLMQEETK